MRHSVTARPSQKQTTATEIDCSREQKIPFAMEYDLEMDVSPVLSRRDQHNNQVVIIVITSGITHR